MLESPAPSCSLPPPVLWSLGDSDVLKSSSDYASGNTEQMMGVGELSGAKGEAQILGDTSRQLTPVLGRAG